MHSGKLIRRRSSVPRSGLLALWFFFVVFCGPVQAQAPQRLNLEAACLYKFIGYVDWPASAFENSASPYIIGIVGTDPFNRILDGIVEGEKINGRPIEVRRFVDGKVGNCHVAFISPSESGRVRSVLDKLKNRSVLTVSDVSGFAGEGGMIGFVTQANKIRFQINLDEAERAHLKISAKLLQLATEIVHTKSRP